MYALKSLGVLGKHTSAECCSSRFLTSVRLGSSDAPAQQQSTDEEGFRILKLNQKKSTSQVRQRRPPPPILPPRETRMATDQKWSDVWPGPRTFHPASVPLPVRQGINNLGASPSKWGNAELMKIPNFLHLTPPAIKMHCEKLKRFCTPWPEGLETEEAIKKHFPLEVITSDYCHSAPTIRNPLSRIVTIKFSLSDLKLDQHAKDKFLRLVGERYDEKTDTVTIVTDKCPRRKQNYDYAIYLLTALYHESWIREPWEDERATADYEYFDWDASISKANVEFFLKSTNQEFSSKSNEIEAYKAATIAVFDEGENDYNWNKYKEASERLLLT
ncbi:ribosomal protein S35 [Nesidiocoris tenuis]|uniref:Ribosomal protein S35 n=1 Tax=Nesidiocoris tenuis TaxID=355587 RepID=A0ABN7BDX5_9HEMI|nr:ribosomal protein S35 [Nesidiocoris tenuis]